MKKNQILALFMVAIMIVALCPCGSFAEASGEYEYPVMTLKFAHNNAIDQPIGIGVDKFAQLIKERSNGNITIDVYPASSLYDEAGIYDAIQLGNLDLGYADVSTISNIVPAFGLYALPMLYDSYETMEKIVDGEVGETLDAMLVDGMNAYALGWTWDGFRNIISNDPITCIADCKDYLLRSPGADLYLDTFKTLGFATVIIPWGDCFTGMQSGLCDAVETTTEAIYTQGFYTIGNNFCVSHHMLSIVGPIINNDLWESFDDQTKSLFQECWDEVNAWERETVASEENEYTELLRDAGCNITKFTDYDEIVELFKPMWEEYAKNGGYEDLLDAAIACKG